MNIEFVEWYSFRWLDGYWLREPVRQSREGGLEWNVGNWGRLRYRNQVCISISAERERYATIVPCSSSATPPFSSALLCSGSMSVRIASALWEARSNLDKMALCFFGVAGSSSWPSSPPFDSRFLFLSFLDLSGSWSSGNSVGSAECSIDLHFNFFSLVSAGDARGAGESGAGETVVGAVWGGGTHLA